MGLENLDDYFQPFRRLRLDEKSALVTPYEGAPRHFLYREHSEFGKLYSKVLAVQQPRRECESSDFHYRTARADWRGHVFHHIRGWSACLKQLPSKLLPLNQLGFDVNDLLPFVTRPGLSLFVGPIDAGKSTSMLSTIMHLQIEELLGETIMIEQPVEYIFDLIEISQRRVGPDVSSYEVGVRDAVRESPRTIVIGEIRDRPSAQAAVRAALLGHRVLSTLHGNNVIDGCTKLSALLDTEHNEVIPQALSGVVAQHLMKGVSTPNVLVYEALSIDREARNVLLEGPLSLHQLRNTFYTQGQRTLEQRADELVQRGVIDEREVSLCLK